MKIGIDTFGCGHGKSGLGSYLFSLVSKLTESDDLKFELFGSELDRYTYSSDSGFNYAGIKIKDSFEKECNWHKNHLNRFAKKHKYDAVLIPQTNLTLPVILKVKVIVVVNSMISEIIENNTNDTSLLLGTSVAVRNLQKAHKIIAASSHIKKDLEKLGIDGSKIAIVFNGIDHSHFYPHELVKESTVEIKPFAIRRPYFIYASSLVSSSKKHLELIRAFSLFKKKTNLPHRLVLAGTEGEIAGEVKKAARESEAASDIFITGFFPHDSFPELYAYSAGCVFPSVNEGVGLPVLEAMAIGIPVACSRGGALPEIAGNNVLYFDSDNIEEIEVALEKLSGDMELRKKLIEGGFEWSKRFSWEKTAERTIEILRSI